MDLKELKNLKENKEEMISEFLFSICRKNFKKSKKVLDKLLFV